MWQLLITATLMSSPPANLTAQVNWSRPDGEVERFAREYRIVTYDAYREDRPAYDDRRAAGNSVLNAWYASGRTAARRQQVIDWFTAATAAPDAALPPLPEFIHTVSYDVPQPGLPRPEVREASTPAPHAQPAAPRLETHVQPVEPQTPVPVPQHAVGPRATGVLDRVESLVEREADDAGGLFGSLGRALWHGAAKADLAPPQAGTPSRLVTEPESQHTGATPAARPEDLQLGSPAP